jgi:glycosyltransferase involved in cell wall biosynthesis
MLTVAHCLPNYNPFPPRYPAGTELRVQQLARLQTRYRPLVICGGFPGESQVEPIGQGLIRRIRFGRAYRRLFQKITRLDPWPYGWRAARLLRAEGAALLHLHNEPKLLTALIPHLDDWQGPIVLHAANEKPLPSALLPRVSAFVGASDYIRRWLLTQGAPPERTSVIYTGADSSRAPGYALPAAHRAMLRRELGVAEPEACVFVFAGRLVLEKGVQELLDAFEHLRASTTLPVYLRVAGNVRDSQDPKNEKARYGRAVTARMKDMPGVHWVGSLHPRAVHDFLCAGDVFVLPALWDDPFPTALLEAAAAGLPILASPTGGIPEFLAGAPGLLPLPDPRNAIGFAHAMQVLAADPELRRTQGGWLRERVAHDFHWERVTTDCEALYQELLGA